MLDELSRNASRRAQAKLKRLSPSSAHTARRAWRSHRTPGTFAVRVLSAREGEFCREPLDVVVEHELPRVWAKTDCIDLVYALVLDPGLDQVVGEHPARLQEVVVSF